MIGKYNIGQFYVTILEGFGLFYKERVVQGFHFMASILYGHFKIYINRYLIIKILS